MWVFESPSLLLLLALVPVGVFFRHIWRGRGGKLVMPFSIWNGRGYRPPATPYSAAITLSAIVYWAGVVCLILAIAGPQVIRRDQVYLTRGADIMVVL
ncbi:MAG: magnesium chelatase, partial [Spirochaetales bacterium]